jgi:hypothetical protein
MNEVPAARHTTNKSNSPLDFPDPVLLLSSNGNCRPLLVEIRMFVSPVADNGLTNTNSGSFGECSAKKSPGSPTITELTGSGKRMVVVKCWAKWTVAM